MLNRFAAPLLGAAVIAAAFTGSAIAQDKPTMGVVVKIGGIPWFNAMEAGITAEGEVLGVDAVMIGPTSADPALQVRAIEDLIAVVEGRLPKHVVNRAALDHPRVAGWLGKG